MADVTITPPAAVVNVSSSPLPISVTIAPAAATVGVSAPTPSVSTGSGVNISPPAARVNVSSSPLPIGVTIAPAAAQVTVSAPAPTITAAGGLSVNISPPAAVVTIPLRTFAVDTAIDVDAALVEVSAPAPSVSTGPIVNVTISPPAATVTVLSTYPDVFAYSPPKAHMAAPPIAVRAEIDFENDPLSIPYTALVKAEGPYSWYRTRETAGPDALDASGAGRTGTYVNSGGTDAAYDLPGPISGEAANRSVEFTAVGSSDFGALVAQGPSGLASFTLEFWMMLRGGGALDNVVFWVGNDGTIPANALRPFLRLANFSALGFGLELVDPQGSSPLGGYSGFDTDAPLAFNQWHHIVLEWSALGADTGVWVLYTNLAGYTSPGGAGAPVTSSVSTYTSDWYLPGPNINYNAGIIRYSEVALYDYTLPYEEIVRHFNMRGNVPRPEAASFVNVSAHGRGVSADIGRQAELDAMEPGSGTLTLQDPDRRYEPEYAASPYFPNVVPTRAARLTPAWPSGQTQLVHNGGFENYPVGASTVQYSGVTPPYVPWPGWSVVTTANTSASLVQWPSFGPPHFNAPNGSYHAILAQITPGANGSVFLRSDPIAVDRTRDYTLAAYIWSAIPNPQAFIYVEAYDVNDSYLGDAKTTQAAAGLANTSDGYGFAPFAPNQWEKHGGVIPALSMPSGTHHVRVIVFPFYLPSTPAPSNGAVYVDSVQLVEGALPLADDDYRNSDGIFTGYVADWPPQWLLRRSITALPLSDLMALLNPYAISGTVPYQDVVARLHHLLDRIDFPASRRIIGQDTATHYLTTESFLLQPVGEMLRVAADSENGIFFFDPAGRAVYHPSSWRTRMPRSQQPQAVFGDGGDQTGELPFLDLQPEYSNQRIINDVVVTDGNGVQQHVRDWASQGRYGVRNYPRETRLADPNDAVTLAGALLANRSTPYMRFTSITIHPERSEALTRAALNLRISDRVRVVRRPYAGGAPVIKEGFIEAIHMDAPDDDPAGTKYTYVMSPAS